MEGAFNTFSFRGENPIGPYLSAHPGIAWLVIAATILVAILYPTLAVYSTNARPRAVISILLSAIASYLVVVMYALLQPAAKDWAGYVLYVFLSCLAIWLFTFHWLAHDLGFYPRSKYGDGRLWIKNWVREIDFAYLSVSSLSLLKLVLSQIQPGNDFKEYNAVAAVALGIALALRITKTSIEVWNWDDPKRAPAGWPTRSRFYR